MCLWEGFYGRPRQRHNELRDLEAELLNTVCSDVEVEPVLQDINREQLNREANIAQDAGLVDGRSAFFVVRACHPDADSYRDLEPQQLYRMHENEKKCPYSSSVFEIEHGTFAPLVFTTTGGMDQECLRYHSRLAGLVALNKREQYAKKISWIRAKN